MAKFLRLSTRLLGRRVHTSAPRRFDPVSVTRQEFGSDLEALKQKEKGPWTALNQEDKVALYHSQFLKTIVEAKQTEPYGKKVIGGVAILTAVAVVFFAFLRKYIGPEPPRSLNEEWQQASFEKMKRQRANPITGISSQ